MLTPEQYLGAVAERIQRSGGRLDSVQIGPATAVVGLFTESVMLTTMNYCVIAAPVPEVSAAALYDFTSRATQHARANLVGTMGWTAGSVVIAGLVGQRVYPDAAQAASAKTSNQFGGETRMVAVDLTAGQMYAFTGGKLWGAAMHGAIRARLTYCFPQPAEVYQQVQWQQAQQPQVPPPVQQQPPPGWQQQPPMAAPPVPPPPYAGQAGPQPPVYPPPGQPPYGSDMVELRGWPSFPDELPVFTPETTPADPQSLFVAWLTEAGEHVLAPHAVTLSTVDADGAPDARVVILKDVGPAGWAVATSSESPKGLQLRKDPRAALTFFWPGRGRQVRLRGPVSPAAPEVSAADFLARPPASRVEAFIGHQSQVLHDPADLDAAAAEAERWVAENPGVAPETWTRYLVDPDEVEFWQASHDRRHVRLKYRKTDGGWVRERLWP